MNVRPDFLLLYISVADIMFEFQSCFGMTIAGSFSTFVERDFPLRSCDIEIDGVYICNLCCCAYVAGSLGSDVCSKYLYLAWIAVWYVQVVFCFYIYISFSPCLESSRELIEMDELWC